MVLSAGCTASRRLDTYGNVPDFALTSQTGQKVTLADLKGKVWIADTIYTTCPGPCPMMSSRMSSIARQLGPIGNLRFVSFTVDPAHDTPEALLAYSRRYSGASNGANARWYFLTGPSQTLNHVSMDGLHLSPVNGSLEHNIEFALVDGKGMVRGYYSPFDPAGVKKLIDDVHYLTSRS